ncbi:MAG: Hsp20/alpha crystallin family protein, partial [Candidatus Yanofskybacteria bacterium]|nr:Hsp20/alpha crystallin family protein [Candidatus Yanofskybacteria bacterium]
TIAGVTADDLDISITNDMVTVKGNRKSDEKVKTSDYYYQELYWGSFSRSIILPEEIDADSAKATMKNGVLTLRLPKLSKSRSKKVKIAS